MASDGSVDAPWWGKIRVKSYATNPHPPTSGQPLTIDVSGQSIPSGSANI